MGHSIQKWSIATSRLGHCDFEIGALRLGHSGSGAFQPHSMAAYGKSIGGMYPIVNPRSRITGEVSTSWPHVDVG